MKLFICICFLFLFFDCRLHAQHENVWTFGANAGIDFNGSVPRVIKTNMATREGSSSVCNAQGQLLFYTDGYMVWNRNHNIMPNGMDLTGVGINITNSTTQGAIIVPLPGKQDQYYIFSLGQFDIRAPYSGRLYYSVVDMALNNGLGDVIHKGMLLDSQLTEHMTAVSGNDCNAWLIVVSRVNNDFKSYNINVNGIDAQPVISEAAEQKTLKTASEILGTMDISPDRSKLGIAQEKVILYNFDPGSGRVADPVILDTVSIHNQGTFYGLCFSPDNTKLYISLPEPPSNVATALFQFDLSSGDPMAMVNSKTVISNEKIYALKRAPDGKVYAATYAATALPMINHPDIAGTGCQFVLNGFPLFEGTYSIFGLPNLGALSPAKIYSTTIDSVLCSEPRTLKAKNLSGQHYVWEDSTLGHTRTVNTPGTYWVRYQVPVNTPCNYEYHVDTFKVIFTRTTRNIATTSTIHGICKEDTIHLEALNTSGIDYLWEDGTIGKSRKVFLAGHYQVSYRVDSLCEFYKDNFVVTYPAKDYKVAFQADTFLCLGDSVFFHNLSDTPYHNFTWFFGDGISAETKDAIHTYTFSGNYEVMLTGSSLNGRCRDTVYQAIIVDSPLLAMFHIFPEVVCVGEPVNIRHTLIDSSIKQLYWTFGDSTYASISDTVLEHHYEYPGMMYIKLNALYRACPKAGYTDSISVHLFPQVDLGADSVLCLHGKSIELQNQYTFEDDYKYLWSTGETMASIRVEHPGTYWLRLSNAAGCTTQESIIITKDCHVDIPNAFTPNGDGVNDYFFPQQQLSKSISTFYMQVFNRWGQKVFETRQPDGRGWDGTYNGTVQPSGVYLYKIDIVTNNRAEIYEGNVTLIR